MYRQPTTGSEYQAWEDVEYMSVADLPSAGRVDKYGSVMPPFEGVVDCTRGEDGLPAEEGGECKSGGGLPSLAIDIIRPKDTPLATKLPCMLVYHGNGGFSGHRRQAISDIDLNGVPFVFVRVSYPVLFWGWTGWDQMISGVRLVEFLTAVADDYGIDPNKFFLVGHSGGAWLALLVAHAAAARGLGVAGAVPFFASPMPLAGPTWAAGERCPHQS